MCCIATSSPKTWSLTRRDTSGSLIWEWPKSILPKTNKIPQELLVIWRLKSSLEISIHFQSISSPSESSPMSACSGEYRYLYLEALSGIQSAVNSIANATIWGLHQTSSASVGLESTGSGIYQSAPQKKACGKVGIQWSWRSYDSSMASRY